jgi:predicted transcriptional regulator
MKSATIPPLRVDPELRSAAESILQEGETLSSFVIDSIRDSIQNRQVKQSFIERGLKARDESKESGEYYDARHVLDELRNMLDNAEQ